MASGLVIGISSESDAKALENALAAAQIDIGKVKVLHHDGLDDTESSTLRFVDVIVELDSDSFADDMTRGTGIMDDSGGTAVPGLEAPGPRLDSFFPHGGTTKDYLADYPVPDDEAENFDEAIADGRAVVLYPDAGPDAQKIAAAFKAAGLQNVRAY